MAFKGKLFIDELELNLLEYDLEFQQPLGFQSRPNDSVKGGIFNVVFEKQEQANYLLNWMAQADMRKNGHISFSGQESEGVLYKQEFWDAYCIGYKETFWNDSSEPMAVRLTFAAGIIRNNKGTIFKQSWHLTDIGSMSEEVQQEEEQQEGQVLSAMITDLEGMEKEKLVPDENVLLILETEYLTGKTINVDLNEEENVSFKYQGTLLADDVIRGYTVKGERDEIQLEVVGKEAKNG
ncbi:type VI secretion system tube protein TssD [Xanthovirga aplysinae]|uniref:type VI secretion system tube protein TssD n=1 Tax=Xanthovirga aplysinae TaxID=2529853 RepID=UPI0012BBA0A0|nr:type VI secretion system tube protein TssD [Xanthovirga aplysinae]MTI29607.1 hypothetical protein [Xanthovirga aplysinae]